MKNITLSLLLFLGLVSGSYAQVQVGEGTNEAQSLPFEPYYGYSYTQSIYLASEINASGTITAIKWFYSGSTSLESSQELVIFMGQTDKETFENNTDFVEPSELIEVYSGGIVIDTPGTPGWVTITLTTPFLYDGTTNLVVAVDESQEDFDNFDDDFRNTAVVGTRSIAAISDIINFDPSDPSNNQGGGPFDFIRTTAAFVPNIIFEGIQQACPNPSGLGVNNLTTVSAELKWGLNPDITLYNVEYGEEGFELGSGMATGNGVANPYPISGLNSQTTYQFYVQAVCESTTSSWVGPFTFTTPCDAITDFSETFEEATLGEVMPECWSKITNSTSEYANIFVVDYNAYSGENAVEMFNDSDLNAQLFLVSPNVTTFEDMRVKFRAYGNNSILEVGTLTNPSDPSTFVAVGTPITLTENYLEYNRTLDGAAGNFVAFRHALGGLYRSISIDDIVFEPVPTVAPECVSDLNVTPDDSCGNYASLFEWSPVEGADGYLLTIGTTSGANDVLDAEDLGNVTSYSFVGNFNQTYYYSLIPYNPSGNAAGCAIDSFETAPDGCYCESIPDPEFTDGDMITNVQIGTSDFPIEPVTYSDNTETETVDLGQAINANVQISFATGFTYDTHIWIDFNDNYIFEANEKVFTGVSTNEETTVLNASFVMPVDAALGTHRMRIGTADGGQLIPNPCYNGFYGITLDFLINVTPAPDCLPPTNLTANTIQANSANLVWMSEGEIFNVEYSEAEFTPGGGTLVSGVTGNNLLVDELSSNTAYQFYVQTVCDAESLSPWAGPFSFTTECDPFGDFEEEFTTDEDINAPECWSTIVETTSQFAYIQMWGTQLEMYTSDDAAANLTLITPNLTALPAGTHRIKFKATSFGTTNLIVGTMTDPNMASTFTAVATVPMPTDGEFVEFSVPFAVTTDSYVALKHGGGIFSSIYFDDVIWEPTPTVIPACVEDVNVTINEECGNYLNLFEWTEVEGADGYKISIGTTEGGNDIIENENIGNVTSFEFTGNFNTTYFYSVIAFNNIGDATGCAGGTFTTVETGCYCNSVPSSFDNGGITNVVLGDFEFAIPEASYTDTSDEGTVMLAKDAETNLIITFATEFTYDTHVWIDFNDNFTFEASELVYSGESSSASPTDLYASFTLPTTATIGVHRMRIGTADSGQEEPNPCYSGSWGVTLDFSVEIFETLGTNSFNSQNFKVYPNPVSNILNLSYTQNITNIAVFNVLGQEVITNNVNTTQGQIDMSHLAVGTYLVKVSAGNETTIVKVLKK